MQMNYKFLLFLDRTLGSIFFKISMFVWGPVNNKAPIKSKIKKVAIIKLAEMGASVHAFPSISHLQNSYGKDSIFLVCLKGYEEIFRTGNLMDEENIFCIRTYNPFLCIYDIFLLRFHFKKYDIDTVLDLNFFTRIGALLGLYVGAKNRLGYSLKNKKDLYTYSLWFEDSLHISQYYKKLIESVTENEVKDDPDFYSNLNKIKANIRYGLPQNCEIILINMNLSDSLPLRKWPVEHYQKLIILLNTTQSNFHFVLIGIKEDIKKSDKFIKGLSISNITSLVGKTQELANLFEIYSISKLLISSDSGLIHFSKFFPDLKLISLFGPETPVLFSPSKENGVDLFKNIECSPCFHPTNNCSSKCVDNQCMKQISPYEVFEVAKNLLNI